MYYLSECRTDKFYCSYSLLYDNKDTFLTKIGIFIIFVQSLAVLLLQTPNAPMFSDCPPTALRNLLLQSPMSFVHLSVPMPKPFPPKSVHDDGQSHSIAGRLLLFRELLANAGGSRKNVQHGNLPECRLGIYLSTVLAPKEKSDETGTIFRRQRK